VPRRRNFDPVPLSEAEVREWALELEAGRRFRPRDRIRCVRGFRPCPWVGCRYHLGLDVTRYGRISLPPSCEPWEVDETCSLDVAGAGRSTLELIGELLGLTRERVRQIEAAALAKAGSAACDDLAAHGREGR